MYIYIYIYMYVYIYILCCNFNVKGRIFDKDKMSKCKKSKSVFCLFGPLIRK